MAAPSKKTAARVLRLREMHAAGASDREISEAIGIHHSTISGWREELGLAPNGAGGPRATRSRATLAAQASPELREIAAAAAGVLAAPLDSALPGDGMAALAAVRERLASVQALIGRLSPEVEDDAYPATSWARLVELEAKLAATVAELTPPAPLDPEKDPTNAAEADKVRMKLERLVSVAEAAARCCHCGRPPFTSARPEPEGVGR